MAILFIRTLITYAVVIFSLRIMGKRQIGELQPSELVVAIMISDLATVPMSDVSIPLLYGIVPIFTLVICEVLLSLVSLKSEWARVFLSGKPQVILKDGKLLRDELKRSRVNVDDLMEELRIAGYFSLSDIDTVILETGGSLSVIPTSESAAPTNKDMGIHAVQQNIPYIFVADGKVRKSELQRSGRDENWIKKIMKKERIPSIEDILILSEDGEGNVFVQRKDKKK